MYDSILRILWEKLTNLATCIGSIYNAQDFVSSSKGGIQDVFAVNVV